MVASDKDVRMLFPHHPDFHAVASKIVKSSRPFFKIKRFSSQKTPGYSRLMLYGMYSSLFLLQLCHVGVLEIRSSNDGDSS